MAKDKIPTSRVGRTAKIGGLAAGQAIVSLQSVDPIYVNFGIPQQEALGQCVERVAQPLFRLFRQVAGHVELHGIDGECGRLPFQIGVRTRITSGVSASPTAIFPMTG